jgi:putative serine protease PepD
MPTASTSPFLSADQPGSVARRRSRTLMAIALSALALVAAGCGSSKGSSAPGSSDSAAPLGSSAASGAAGSAGPASSVAASAGGTSTAVSGGTAALEQSFETVVANVSPSVVVIETNEGLGSGVVLDDRGDIVTNAHVVGTSTTFSIATADGKRLEGTLVGSFPPDDVAVVRAKDAHLTGARFADSSTLKVGQIVLAIGNPLGLQSSVTDGIVSALGRTVNEPTGAALPGVIQTSAPINPGNSGGALVDLDGQVVGIPTLAASDPQMGGSAPGIGFAVPSNIATDIARQLIENGKVTSSHRAYLGIRTANVSGAQGVLVFSVEAGGPAAKAGIPEDVLITSIAGQPTPDSPTLSAVLAGLQPGQAVDVEIVKQDGSTSTVKVTLGELPG